MSTDPTIKSTTLSSSTTTTTTPLPPSHATTTAPPTASTPRTLRISTRSSALALAQTTLFTTLLSTHPDPTIAHTVTSIHPIHTSLGDTNKTTALHTLASTTGKSLWTEDLEHALAHDQVDIIVHSLKDVPTKLPTRLICSAIGRREEARDCVVLSPRWAEALRLQRQHDSVSASSSFGSSGLEILPPGSTIGTSSIRRAAMIRRAYPHLVIRDLRGNVPTRIKKVDADDGGEVEGGKREGNYDAAVLAGAGVQRLGLQGRISGWLDPSTSTSKFTSTPSTSDSDERGGGMLHAVGQGAIGVEWRESDDWVAGLVRGLLHVGKRERRVGWEGLAERELLRVLEGGCSVPVGVDCVWEEAAADEREKKEDEEKEEEYGGILIMQAMVLSVDGQQCVRASSGRHRVSSDTEAEECGWRIAQQLVEKGAGEILKEITLNRDMIQGQDGA